MFSNDDAGSRQTSGASGSNAEGTARDRRRCRVLDGRTYSAALLALPGASSYFLGGAVVYTQSARASLLDIPNTAMAGMRAATEPYAVLLARSARQRFSATWALAETGATGPTGNRYGDPPGHSCVAVAGASERAITLETGSADRLFRTCSHSALPRSIFSQQPSSGCWSYRSEKGRLAPALCTIWPFVCYSALRRLPCGRSCRLRARRLSE